MSQRKLDWFQDTKKKEKKRWGCLYIFEISSLSGTGMNLRDGMGREVGREVQDGEHMYTHG